MLLTDFFRPTAYANMDGCGVFSETTNSRARCGHCLQAQDLEWSCLIKEWHVEVLNLTVEASPRAVCAVIDSLVENYFYSLFCIASHVLFCISLNLVYKFSLQYKVSEVSRLFSISAT